MRNHQSINSDVRAGNMEKDAEVGLFENRMALTVAEVAKALGKKPNAIYLLIHRRAIPFRKVGRRVMFIPEEIRAWLKGGAANVS